MQRYILKLFRVGFVSHVALLMAACSFGPDWPAISLQAEALRAGCESQLASGTLKTHLAAEQCANPSIHNLYAKSGWLDIDVLDAFLARREAIAEQWDRHAITAEEARAQFAEATVAQNTELQHRAADRAVGSAAMRSAQPLICTRVGTTFICQ